MILSVFLVLFLSCAGTTAIIIVYLCLLWYSVTSRLPPQPMQLEKSAGERGLSTEQLSRLPSTSGRELAAAGAECALCLDKVGAEQPVRLFPGCNHGFHAECADMWLSMHPMCPVCRAMLRPEFFECPDQNWC